MSDTLMIKVRKFIMKAVKPFTIAQPYFSALLIGFLGIFSINYVQSKIVYFEKVGNQFESKVEVFHETDEIIRNFAMMNSFYIDIYKDSNSSIYSHEQTLNQLSGQMQRAEKVLPLLTASMLALDKAKKFLDRTAHQTSLSKNEQKQLQKVLHDYEIDSEKTMEVLLSLNNIFIPYIGNSDICMQNDSCDYNSLLVPKDQLLFEYVQQARKMDFTIQNILNVLQEKKKEEAYRNLLAYWFFVLFGLYVIIFFYTNFVKIDDSKLLDTSI